MSALRDTPEHCTCMSTRVFDGATVFFYPTVSPCTVEFALNVHIVT